MRSFRSLSFLVLLAGFLLLAACGDFFVSQNAIDTVSFTPNAVLLKTGDSITLTPLVTTVGQKQSNPTSGVTWTSSNTTVATIDDTGKLTAGTTAGTTTIKATYSNVSGTGTAIVTAGALPSTLTVNGNQTILLTSPNVQFTATAALNGNNNFDLTQIVSWSSNPSSVASVNTTGKVTALSACGLLTGITCPTITATINTTSSTLTGSLQISTIQ